MRIGSISFIEDSNAEMFFERPFIGESKTFQLDCLYDILNDATAAIEYMNENNCTFEEYIARTEEEKTGSLNFQLHRRKHKK
jgi:hypothetical protein